MITKTLWKGKRMFSLTLEERATCPTSCHHWKDCYGNNMPFAHRFAHGTELMNAIDNQLSTLMNKYPQGIVVRLHVLGDFWDVDYVEFWDSMLGKYPMLAIYGYTAHYLTPDIKKAIDYVNTSWRCYIRYSHNADYSQNDNVRFAATEDYKGDTFDCPEQLGRVDSCAKCGACFNERVTKTVRFLSH